MLKAVSDRFGAHAMTWWVLWVAWIALFVLSYPQTELIVHTIRGPAQFGIGLGLWLFVPLLFVLGAVLAFGMASTFKYLGDDYPDNLGIVTGIVGLVGGLAGFLLPIIWGAVREKKPSKLPQQLCFLCWASASLFQFLFFFFLHGSPFTH